MKIPRLFVLLLLGLGACMGPSLQNASSPEAVLAYWKQNPGLGTPAEELWIFERSSLVLASDGFLSLGDDPERELPIELQRVRAQVVGRTASVQVHQRFHNPSDEPLDAVYALRLPGQALVTDFTLRIGERHIRGIVREREEAEAIFVAARSHGLLANLIRQERTDRFRHSIVGLDPGESIEVRLDYFHALPLRQGVVELAVPLVDQNAMAQTELELSIEAGLALDEVRVRGEARALDVPGERAELKLLASADASPFVVCWRVSGPEPRAFLRIEVEPSGTYYQLWAYPAHGTTQASLDAIDWAELTPLDRLPGPGLLQAGRLEGRSVSTRPLTVEMQAERLPLQVQTQRRPTPGPARRLWAQLELARLTGASARAEQPEEARALAERARTLALEHGITSLFTSFVLVDSLSG